MKQSQQKAAALDRGASWKCEFFPGAARGDVGALAVKGWKRCSMKHAWGRSTQGQEHVTQAQVGLFQVGDPVGCRGKRAFDQDAAPTLAQRAQEQENRGRKKKFSRAPDEH